MDAYAFIAHGHVFANAQTGNVVLLTVAAASGQWTQSVRHLPPIIACVLGVATAKLIGVRPVKRTFRATLVCQTIELIAVILLAFFTSSLPNPIVVPTLSFVAALQITSFDMLGPWNFNSAMTTGNLKHATIGLVLWLKGENRRLNLGKAAVSGTAVLSFLLGALLGAWYTRRQPAHALLPCVFLLGVAYIITWQERLKQPTS